MRLPEILDIDDRLRTRSDLAADYERGSVLTKRIAVNPIFADLTCTLSDEHPKHHIYKKMKMKMLTKPLSVSTLRGHLIGGVTNDLKKALAIQRAMVETEAAIERMVKGWFPSYRWTYKNSTYRFMATRDEDLHWDYYGHSDPMVRTFVNLDTEPRVWRLGPMLPDYCAEFGDDMGLEAGDDISQVAFKASARVDRMRDTDTLVHEFTNATLWVVHSQIVSHQVLYGNRMYALALAFDPATLGNQSLNPPVLAKAIKRGAGIAA